MRHAYLMKHMTSEVQTRFHPGKRNVSNHIQISRLPQLTDDKQSAHELQPHLPPIARDCAARVRQTKSSAALLSGKQPDHEAPAESSDHVSMHDAQGVVDVVREQPPLLAGDVHGHPGDGAGDEAEDDRCPTRNHAGGGCDRDQSRDHAIDCADDGRLFVVEYVA